MADLTVNN